MEASFPIVLGQDWRSTSTCDVSVWCLLCADQRKPLRTRMKRAYIARLMTLCEIVRVKAGA